MIFVTWLGISIAFAVVATFANRIWGTVLAALPVAAWFVQLVVAMQGGNATGQGSALGLSIVAVVLGLCTMPLFERLKPPRTAQSGGHP